MTPSKLLDVVAIDQEDRRSAAPRRQLDFVDIFHLHQILALFPSVPCRNALERLGEGAQRQPVSACFPDAITHFLQFIAKPSKPSGEQLKDCPLKSCSKSDSFLPRF